jgi:acetyltransferase-like isoleucine patch superfamily enzyme
LKNIARSILKFIVRHTRKYVWAVARAYNLKVEIPAHPHGRFPVVVEGGEQQIQDNIPGSVYFNTASGSITIGSGTSFGYDVRLVTGKHVDIGEAERTGIQFHHVPEGRDITIGRYCFIGTGAIVIGPVVIGDYAVVGAGSVVTRDLEPRGFYAGVPAAKIRDL